MRRTYVLIFLALVAIIGCDKNKYYYQTPDYY